jgi:hypothetical protein
MKDMESQMPILSSMPGKAETISDYQDPKD